ncbi:response regulator [Candidatus Micrarchaeota archaeon]|nr:response regulator [Candidatus Micrarchaeota archaeon]
MNSFAEPSRREKFREGRGPNALTRRILFAASGDFSGGGGAGGPEITYGKLGGKQTKKHLNILVVDDERDINGMLKLVLEVEGHRVRIAENGQQALDIVDGGATFDIIIVDIRMPVMNGLTLLNEIKTRRNYGMEIAPAIVGTGEELVDGGAEFIAAGAVRVIRKPYDLDQVIRIVEEVANG